MKKRDYSVELENLVDNTRYIEVDTTEEMKKSFIASLLGKNYTSTDGGRPP